MKIVILDGWQTGLNKVALTKLIQQRAGLSLAAAKSQTDLLLEGGEIGILLLESEPVEDFVAEAERLGASAHVVSVEVGDARRTSAFSGSPN